MRQMFWTRGPPRAPRTSTERKSTCPDGALCRVCNGSLSLTMTCSGFARESRMRFCMYDLQHSLSLLQRRFPKQCQLPAAEAQACMVAVPLAGRSRDLRCAAAIRWRLRQHVPIQARAGGSRARQAMDPGGDWRGAPCLQLCLRLCMNRRRKKPMTSVRWHLTTSWRACAHPFPADHLGCPSTHAPRAARVPFVQCYLDCSGTPQAGV